MRSRSDRLFGVTAIGILLLVPTLIGAVRVTSTVIVPPNDIITEDLYAFAERVIIDGTVNGDLFVVAGEVIVNGVIQGDLLGLVGGAVRVPGTVEGSVRVAAVSVEVTGNVVNDVAIVSVDGRVDGTVGRDVLHVVGGLHVGGSVARDLRGQGYRLTIDSDLGRNAQVRADRITVGPDARIGGDLIYESSGPATVSDQAVVSGDLVQREVLTPVWTRAVTRLVAVLSLFGFIVAGLLVQWLFRGLSQRAIETVESRPWKALGVGAMVLIVPPILVLPLFLTLVGIPVALVILVLWAIMLFLGPLPAVTTAGTRLLRSSGGIAGGLVVGAALFRGALWLLPLIAGFIYLGFLLVGVGSYTMAAWSLRKQAA